MAVGEDNLNRVGIIANLNEAPTNAQACKDGGWRNFRTPVFKNQGACVSHVNPAGPKGAR